ncbi:MAG: Maf family protein [Vicinamibacterales bacterium]
MRLILASASPRRAELLRAARIEFDVLPAAVDESALSDETPEQHVRRLADAKARAVQTQAGNRPVLSADTVVVVDGRILGKPAGDADARRMLRMLSGRSHEVMTGVCLMYGASVKGEGGKGQGTGGRDQGTGGKEQGEGDRIRTTPTVETGTATAVAVTTVEFAPLTEAEIAWYVASGEPADKAGAYAIQGLASRFVTRIDGSYSNVVGLPVAVVYHLCTRAGLLIS